MILTKNNNCDSITVNSNLFSQPGELSLTVEINCCKKNTAVLTPLSIQQGFYLIQPSMFGWDVLKDGIYSVTLELKQANGSIKKEVACLFVDCYLLCFLVSFMANNPESKAYQKYELLKAGENCQKCDCSDFCLLYDALLKDLNDVEQDKCSCCN